MPFGSFIRSVRTLAGAVAGPPVFPPVGLDIRTVQTPAQLAAYLADLSPKPDLSYAFVDPLTDIFVAFNVDLLPGGAPAEADSGIGSAMTWAAAPYTPEPEYTKVPPNLDYTFPEPITDTFSAITISLLPGGAPAEADSGIDSAARASQDPYDPTTEYTKTKPSTALPVSTWPS